MQKFQETGLARASFTRPVNLKKPIPNTFKMVLNAMQMLNRT